MGREEGSKVLACLAPSLLSGLCNNFGEFHQKREAWLWMRRRQAGEGLDEG